MGKYQIIKELIIKFFAACISLICIIFVVENMISMFPLFQSMKMTESEIWNCIHQTRLGTLYNSMIVTDDTPIIKMVEQGLFSFFKNIQWFVIVFLCFVLVLFLLRFLNLDDDFVKKYLNIHRWIILIYISKYLFMVLGMAIFFRDSIRSVSIGLVFDTTISMVFDLLLIFFLSLFIIKFVLNISSDMKEIKSLVHKI